MPAVLAEWTAGGGAAVEFLRRHLEKAPAPPDAKRIAAWIADLDDDAFAVRQQAVAQLARFGEYAEPQLLKRLEKPVSLEARRRIEALLAQREQEVVTPPPDTLQWLRALEVLERIGSAEARQVVVGLAKGYPGASLTQDAEATGRRMAQKAGS
jgi:hypothetical protein